MKINAKYQISNIGVEYFLADVVDGDVYKINDVVVDIINYCKDAVTIQQLCDDIFMKYQNEDEGYSKEDLYSFIEDLINRGIIIP